LERFVFIAAVTFAIIFAVVAFLGHGNFGMHFDVDARGMAPVVETAPGRMEAQAYQGNELRVKHAAAHITITPEDRQDFLVEIDNPGRAPMPTVSADEGRVIIDGQLRGRVDDCLEGGGASLRGYGELALADLPRITIRAPRAVNLDLSGGSTTEVGPSESVNLDFSGCGAASLGDVVGELSVDVAGSGNIQAGAAHSLNADVAGSGRVVTGAIADGADIDIAGSGEVVMASLTGSLGADGAGSGNVTVQGGQVSNAKIDLAGSGGVDIAAPVQRLEVSILGSGSVDVDGVVGDLVAEVAGSGSVSATSVTGTVSREVLGAGRVNIGAAQPAENAP
jgi:hypothetical protein